MRQGERATLQQFYNLYCLHGKLEARSAKSYNATKRLIESLEKMLDCKFTDTEIFCEKLRKYAYK